MERFCTRGDRKGSPWTGFEVVDRSREPVGTVLSLWFHERADAVQFFGIQTAGDTGNGCVVPAEGVQVDRVHCCLQLPYSRAVIEEAPVYPSDAKFTLEQERDIYLHFDVQVTAYPSAGNGRQLVI